MKEMFSGASSFAQTLCGAWLTSTANKDGMFDGSPGRICTPGGKKTTSKTTSTSTETTSTTTGTSKTPPKLALPVNLNLTLDMRLTLTFFVLTLALIMKIICHISLTATLKCMPITRRSL
jgi:hypothetical protein